MLKHVIYKFESTLHISNLIYHCKVMLMNHGLLFSWTLGCMSAMPCHMFLLYDFLRDVAMQLLFVTFVVWPLFSNLVVCPLLYDRVVRPLLCDLVVRPLLFDLELTSASSFPTFRSSTSCISFSDSSTFPSAPAASAPANVIPICSPSWWMASACNEQQWSMT